MNGIGRLYRHFVQNNPEQAQQLLNIYKANKPQIRTFVRENGPQLRSIAKNVMHRIARNRNR